MRKKVLLFHPKTEHEKNYSYFWIPYSLLTLATELKEAGYEPQIFDENLHSEYSHLDVSVSGATSLTTSRSISILFLQAEMSIAQFTVDGLG